MSISSVPATGAVVGAKATSLLQSEAANASCASVLLLEDEELADNSLTQQVFLEQLSACETLVGETGFEALLQQQLVLEQSPVATVASVAGFESLMLKQPVLEQSSIFGEEAAETAETALTEPLQQLLLKQSSIADAVASEDPLARLLLLQLLSLEQSSILEIATSGRRFATALEESPQQLLFSEQPPAFLVSIDGIDSRKTCVLGYDLTSFAVSDSADVVDRFERIDA
jgi:hypothetical protein